MTRRKTARADVRSAAAILGSLGGKAKAEKLTTADREAIGKQLAEARKRIPPEERKRIAKAAAAAREARREKKA